MTARRQPLASGPRPSSAIYIGDSTLSLPSTPPSPAHSTSSTRSQLPSPPASNSTGSIGDGTSTGTDSVGSTHMLNGDRHRRRSSSNEDDDDDEHDSHDNGEDHTAKLYLNDTRAAKGKEPESAFSTIQRVKSLTEKNRRFIDRISSITASDALSRSSATPSRTSSIRSRSPFPPTVPSSSSSAASSSSRAPIEPYPLGGSGSETERERERPTIRQDTLLATRHQTASTHEVDYDNNDVTTPASSVRYPDTRPRQRLRSAPSPPPKNVTLSPRKQTSTAFSIIGSGRRTRRVSIQNPDNDLEEEGGSSTSPTLSASKRSRAPLPREFLERQGTNVKSPGEHSTFERARTASPGVFTGQGTVSENSSGAGGTFSTSPASPRSQRPARPSTLRESSRRAQRWSSVDEATTNGNDDRRRHSRQGGSAESVLGHSIIGREGRSVVGEGLRAAGLARRDDVFVDQARRSRTSVNGAELDELRHGIARVLEPRTPLTAPGRSAAGIHSVLSGGGSRAGTALGNYDDSPRTASQSFQRRTPHMRSDTSASAGTGTFGRSSAPPAPSSEHARLMLEALGMFEAQVARLPAQSTPSPDVARTAQSLAHSAATLNSLLRTANARALESQIEAEIGDEGGMIDATEVWRRVGGEYRECVRVSDELVRSVTGVLLGVGRLVREVGSAGTGGGGGSGRSSLDGDGTRGGRRSLDGGDGRKSVEGSTYRDRERDARRSWDEDSRQSQEPASRPSTSLSMARAGGKADEEPHRAADTARERARSSALERLSIRRVFTPRSSRDAGNHPSPTPLPRENTGAAAAAPRGLPPPLPVLPSERAGGSARRSAKSSNTTVRAGTTWTAAMLSPRSGTTALTPHTVSVGSTARDAAADALSGIMQGRKRTISASAGEESGALKEDERERRERRERRRTIDDAAFP